MIPELGYGATVGALVRALWGAVAAATSARTGHAALLRTGERAAVAPYPNSGITCRLRAGS